VKAQELSWYGSRVSADSVAIKVLTTQAGKVGVPVGLVTVLGAAGHRAPPPHLLRGPRGQRSGRRRGRRHRRSSGGGGRRSRTLVVPLEQRGRGQAVFIHGGVGFGVASGVASNTPPVPGRFCVWEGRPEPGGSHAKHSAKWAIQRESVRQKGTEALTFETVRVQAEEHSQHCPAGGEPSERVVSALKLEKSKEEHWPAEWVRRVVQQVSR